MNFGPVKLLFTAVAALLILGPKRLPGALRSLSKAMNAVRKASSNVSQELRAELDPDGHLNPDPDIRVAAPPGNEPAPPQELRPGPR